MKAIDLGLSISFTGHHHFQEVRSAARTRGRTAGRSHHGRDRCTVSRARKIRGKRNEPSFVVEVAKVHGGNAWRFA